MAHTDETESAVDCVIVGGGPAGLTAATYLRRFHRSVVVIDDGRSRASWIPTTHNCPGFPRGVSGNELLERLRLQATEYGACLVRATVERIHQAGEDWVVGSADRQWRPHALILATGVEDILPSLSVDASTEALRKGLLRLCAICDGYEATDCRIGVIGPLEDALAHACFLRAFSADVTVIPTAAGQASADTMQRSQHLQIATLPPLRTLSFADAHAHVLDQAGGRHRFDTVYVAMGAPGRVGLAQQLGLNIGPKGELVTDHAMQTALSRVYAIGDVVTDLNQISVAFGHAAIAATAIHRRLPENPRR